MAGASCRAPAVSRFTSRTSRAGVPTWSCSWGQFGDGRKFELIQHYSQVSVLLVAVPKMKDEPRRIGFELLKNVRDLPLPWGDPIS